MKFNVQLENPHVISREQVRHGVPASTGRHCQTGVHWGTLTLMV